MDDKITVSTFQLFEMFPDQESVRKKFKGSQLYNSQK